MKAMFFDEPELEFGRGCRHPDIRCGLSAFGTLDAGSELAPSKIRLGVIGTQSGIEEFTAWVSKCRGGIEKKDSPLGNLFPAFPGFGSDKPLCDFVTNEELLRPISLREIRQIAASGNREQIVLGSVEKFVVEAGDLFQKATCDVVVCLPPPELLLPIDSRANSSEIERQSEDGKSKRHSRTDWHDLLKAKGMSLKGPIQMVRPATYGGKVHRYLEDGRPSSDVEDEATRAWNFFTALYYKAGGVPWRLVRNASDYDTCFIGISYFYDPSGERVQTSVAQVFNERGEGVVVKGGQALVQKDDKTYHMDSHTSEDLLRSALLLYRREHRNLPARVVCHKSSYFDEGEMQGFDEAAGEMGIDQIDMMSIRKSSVRLFRNRPYPPLRGTAVELDARTSLLYTQGSVEFYHAYPGQYVPRPIEVKFDRVERNPGQILPEILALTKMNWNSTRFVNAEPITIAAARNVGDVLRYVEGSVELHPRYSFYM